MYHRVFDFLLGGWRRSSNHTSRWMSSRISLCLVSTALLMSAVGGVAYSRVTRTLHHISDAQDVRLTKAIQPDNPQRLDHPAHESVVVVKPLSAGPSLPVAAGQALATSTRGAPEADQPNILQVPTAMVQAGSEASRISPSSPLAQPLTATSRKPIPLMQQPFTVLIIGVDMREAQVNKSARADTLVLVRLDPKTGYASLLSIPRDTLVTIPSATCGGTRKINAAYTCGYLHPTQYGKGATPTDAGMALAAETVETYLEVPVDYTMQVDFSGFVQIIDALGGITVDVPERIVDPAYPTDDGGTMRIEFAVGRQHMDGMTALQYTRTRHADNDFGRARRQQQVLLAVLDRFKEQGWWHQIGAASELLDIVGQSIHTTMPLHDLRTVRALAELAGEMQSDQVQRFVLRPETTIDGAYNFQMVSGSAIRWNESYVRKVVQRFESPSSDAN